KNGVKVQPNGSVTVSIPVPENFSPYFHVCSIGEDGKSITTLARSVGGGYATFTTDHLGRFAIVQEVNAELGDVNADGVINSVDALRVLQHSVNVIQLQGRAAKRADVNKDEKINPVDALDILRYSVGIIKDFS
ncbi:MAG: dockerin type I repeat-containing protein, partial [Oscillospiraceae bacterium]|nr:dockerin type I repeat-containing protein [Oscillospiraceae bacterium]